MANSRLPVGNTLYTATVISTRVGYTWYFANAYLDIYPHHRWSHPVPVFAINNQTC